MRQEKRHLPENRMTYEAISKYRAVLLGIAILGILLFHFTEDCHRNGVLTGLGGYYYTYIRSAFVDVFLCLSGLGCYYSLKKSGSVRAFYGKRFPTALLPYLLVCLPAWAIRDFGIRHGSVRAFFADISFVTFFRSNQTWFWYILMACVCYLLFPLVFRLFESTDRPAVERVYMLVAFLVFAITAQLMRSHTPELYETVRIAWLRFPAFFFGCMIGKAAYEKRTIRFPVWILSFLSVPCALLMPRSSIIWIYYLCAFLTLSLCLWILWLLTRTERFSRVNGSAVRALSWVGQYTLELYLIHATLRRLFNNLFGWPTYELRWTLLMWGMSFVGAYFLKKLTGRILRAPVFHRQEPKIGESS